MTYSQVTKGFGVEHTKNMGAAAKSRGVPGWNEKGVGPWKFSREEGGRQDLACERSISAP